MKVIFTKVFNLKIHSSFRQTTLPPSPYGTLEQSNDSIPVCIFMSI